MHTVQRAGTALAWMALGVCCLRRGELGEAEAALGEANALDRWDAPTWGYCAVLCARAGRWVEGEQALCLAARLALRDFRLIREILASYAGRALGEEAARCAAELARVAPGECHAPLEADGAEGADGGE
jgi:Flp pilus assembly protein TadD